MQVEKQAAMADLMRRMKPADAAEAAAAAAAAAAPAAPSGLGMPAGDPGLASLSLDRDWDHGKVGAFLDVCTLCKSLAGDPGLASLSLDRDWDHGKVGCPCGQSVPHVGAVLGPWPGHPVA